MTKAIWWIGEEENGEVPINAPEWGAFAKVVVKMENGEEISEGYDNARLIVRAVELYSFAKTVLQDKYFSKKLQRREPEVFRIMQDIINGIDTGTDDKKALECLYDKT